MNNVMILKVKICWYFMNFHTKYDFMKWQWYWRWKSVDIPWIYIPNMKQLYGMKVRIGWYSMHFHIKYNFIAVHAVKKQSDDIERENPVDISWIRTSNMIIRVRGQGDGILKWKSGDISLFSFFFNDSIFFF